MTDLRTFHTIGYTVAGRRHASMCKENEDGYEIYEDDRLLVLCVADGCSESTCAKAASEAVLKALIEFAKSDIWEMKPRQMKNNVLKVIDKYLLAAPYEYRLLACTCALVAYNKVTNSYIALSIGDCQAAVMTEELEPRQLLAPVNIFGHREHTVFANSSMAASAMKLEFGSASDIAGFLLITDGAERLCEASHADDLIQLSSICVLSQTQAQTALEEYVSNQIASATNDDITVLMAMHSNHEPLARIAEATCNTIFEPSADGLTHTEDEEKNGIEMQLKRTRPSELLSFLATPRTAEELVIAGYCIPSEVLTYLYPLIKEGFVVYENYHFSAVKGG